MNPKWHIVAFSALLFDLDLGNQPMNFYFSLSLIMSNRNLMFYTFRFGSTNDYVRYRMEARRVKRFQIGDSISPSSFVPVKRKSRTSNHKVSPASFHPFLHTSSGNTCKRRIETNSFSLDQSFLSFSPIVCPCACVCECSGFFWCRLSA